MDKAFIIWLLTVICISWLIMLTVYVFKLKRVLEYLREQEIMDSKIAYNQQLDIGSIYKRLHHLEELHKGIGGDENEHEL